MRKAIIFSSDGCWELIKHFKKNPLRHTHEEDLNCTEVRNSTKTVSN